MNNQSDSLPKESIYGEQYWRMYELLGTGKRLFKPIMATEVEYLHPHVGIRRVWGTNGRLNLEIVIDDKTKKDHLRKYEVWERIRKETQEIADIQGPELSDHFAIMLHQWQTNSYEELVDLEDASLKYPLKRKSIRKPTYRDLAMDVNFDSLVFLVRASRSPLDGNDDRHKLAVHLFKSILGSFNWKDTEIDSYIRVCLEEIKENRCPFNIYSDPITRDQLSNVLEYLVKVADIPKSLERSKKNFLELHRFFLSWCDWLYAEALLKRTYLDTYQRYKSRLRARKAEILNFAT